MPAATRKKKHPAKLKSLKPALSPEIVFIVFPGAGGTRKTFKLNDNNGQFDNTNDFLEQLEKMGRVHFIEQPWNNLNYYNDGELPEQYLYSPEIDFTLADLNPIRFCEKVFAEVNAKVSPRAKFILVGHSAGSLPIYYFSQRYPERCLANFVIDGVLWGPFYHDKQTYAANVKLAAGVTNQRIQELLSRIKTRDLEAIHTLTNILGGFIDKQSPKNAKKLKVPTYSFRNLQIYEDPGGQKYLPEQINTAIDSEDYFRKHNPDTYKTIYCVNATHMIYWNKPGRETILNHIRLFVKDLLNHC